MEAVINDRVQQRKRKLERFFDYVVLYFLVGMASMPFFIGNEFLYIFFFFSMIIFVFKKMSFDLFIVYYCLVYLLIFLFQSVMFSVFEVNIVLGYFMRILYAYVAMKILGENLPKYFVRLMYVFTLISFVFYFPSLLFEDQVNGFLTSISKYIDPFQLNFAGRSHILVYTFGEEYSDTSGFVESTVNRNSGPFWEPGGFGIFLVLAVLFELIMTKKIVTKNNIVFFIAILTTLSTGTFFALFALVVLYLITYATPNRIFLLIFFVISALFLYTNLFFLNEKVNDHLSKARTESLKYAPRNRFVSAQLDIIDFMNYPILGRGRFVATRFDVKESKEEIYLNHRSNGTTNLLVEFGFFGFIYFFLTMYYSFRAFCGAYRFRTSFAFYSVLLVMVLGFYEMIFNKPFFIGISFMFLAAGFHKKIAVPSLKKFIPA